LTTLIIYVKYIYHNKKIDKTEFFKYTILNYNENYEKLLKYSKNNFLIIGKKQKIRIKFINEIIKPKNNKHGKEQNFTNHSLFNIILLTIILIEFLKENYILKNNNDIQQNLLKYSIELLNYQYSNISNLKLIIFYLAHMFVILFNGMNDINNYFQIENSYIKKIEIIMNKRNDNSVITNEEIFPFLKINLLCIGYLLIQQRIKINLSKETELILLYYYIKILNSYSPIIIENYEQIKQNYFYDNNDFIRTKTTIFSKSNSKSNIDITKSQEFIDFKRIIESFYNFLSFSITDISYGNKYFKIIDKEFNNIINNTELHKFNEILFFFLYKEIIEKDLSKFVIFSIIILIHNKILDDIKNNYIFYYDIIIKYYQLIMSDEILNEKCFALFAKIFINEINNIEYYKSLILKLIYTISKKKYAANSLIHLIKNISLFFNKQDIKNKLEIYKRCCFLLDKYSDKNFSKMQKRKEKINLEYIKIIISNFNNYNNFQKKLNINEQKLIINYFDFYIYFINFTESNFYNLEIYSNHSYQNKIYLDIFSYIYQLEIYSIDSTEYLTQIIQLIKILLYFFFNKNYIKNIEDSYTIYKFLGHKYRTLLNKTNNGKNLSFLPYLSYYTTIFILMKVLNTPNFFIIIHSCIIEGINNIDKEYYIKFKEIQFENIIKKYININIENSLKELYQDLKTYFNYYFEYEIDINIFQRIIDVIYTQIFGCSSILITFFNNQFKELGIEKIIDTINNSTYDSNGTDIITEGNEKFYENYLKDDSISIKLNEEKKSINENSIDGFSNEHLINIPMSNSLKIINDNNLIDVFLSEEDNITL